MRRICLIAAAGALAFALPRFGRAQEDPRIRDLEERIRALEERSPAPAAPAAEEAGAESRPLLAENLLEKKFLEGIELVPGVLLSGLLEVEAEYEAIQSDEGGDRKSSDLKLATFELGVDVDAIRYVHAHALLLWEEDETEPVDLDEGFVTLGAEEDFPGYLTAGKLYVPFGVFESHFISDPLTLELGETRESAVLVGYEDDLLGAALGAFRGEVGKAGSDPRVNNLVAALNLTPVEGLTLGGSWITDIAEGAGLIDLIPEGEVEEFVGGASAYFILALGPLTLNAEYLGALKSFEEIPDPEAKGTELEGKEPKAWNTELTWAFVEDWEGSVRYEGSDEFPGFPENQGGLCLSWGCFPNTTVSAEYLYGEYGNGDHRNLTTAQLAFEF